MEKHIKRQVSKNSKPETSQKEYNMTRTGQAPTLSQIEAHISSAF